MSVSKQSADVAIIGGGPAGLSAASWCSELGLDAVLIERSGELGGQLHAVHNPITNYLGIQAENGRDLLRHFLASVEIRSFDRVRSCEVIWIDPKSMSVRQVNGESLAARALILATGVRRRTLEIPGELEFRGRGILESGVRERHLVTDKRVLIVGGGDAAIENAILLSDEAAEVAVSFRRAEPTARPEFVRNALKRSNISFLSESRVVEIKGNATVESATLENVLNCHRVSRSVDAVLVRIGVEPNSELLAGKADLDNRGYVLVNNLGETSLPGIFAIGDVANPISPTISTAVGSGATAAKSAFEFIENHHRESLSGSPE